MTDAGRLSDIIDTCAETNPPDLQAQMDGAARLLAALPANRRAGALVRFLEELDGNLSELEFKDVVGDMMLALARRLKFGTWQDD